MDNIINFNIFGVDYTVNDNKNQWSGGLGMSRGDWEKETFKIFEYVKKWGWQESKIKMMDDFEKELAEKYRELQKLETKILTYKDRLKE